MKKMMLLVCCFLCFSAFAASAGSHGYGKTQWGMNPDQVVAAEGGKVHKLNPPEKYANSLGMVGNDRVEIASSDFKVVYQFVNNSLSQVLLKTLEDKNVGINSSTFQELDRLLTQKYGSPTYKENGKAVTWKTPGTTIELRHLYIEGVITSVTVHYSSDSESDKKIENL